MLESNFWARLKLAWAIMRMRPVMYRYEITNGNIRPMIWEGKPRIASCIFHFCKFDGMDAAEYAALYNHELEFSGKKITNRIMHYKRDGN